MRISSLITLSTTLLLATPAIAQSTSQTGAAAATAAQTEKTTAAEKKICRRLTISGSRMGERVCLTRDAWKKVDDQK
jgi:hypothetical protein